MSKLEFLVGSAVLLLPRGNLAVLAGATAVKGAGGCLVEGKGWCSVFIASGAVSALQRAQQQRPAT
jgi:hypothetical protein